MTTPPPAQAPSLDEQIASTEKQVASAAKHPNCVWLYRRNVAILDSLKRLRAIDAARLPAAPKEAE